MKKIKQHTNRFSAFLYQMIRVERRCSQKDLGIAVGYEQSSISAIMLEKSEGKETNRIKIAEFFGFTYPEALDYGEEIIKRQKEDIEKKSNPAVRDLAAEAKKRHQVIINGFRDTEWALAINEMLVEIERKAPELKNIIKGSIENFVKNLPEKKAVKKTGTDNNLFDQLE